MHLVSTSQAAALLEVSDARVRQLLIAGRIRGAYKIGKFWVIPLFDGQVSVTKGKRGPKPKKKTDRPRAATKVYINRQKLAQNHKQGTCEPVISVNKASRSIYGHEVAIDGPCRIIYNPEAPNNPRIWIETVFGVRVFNKNYLEESLIIDNVS
jgi:hypothetical protein